MRTLVSTYGPEDTEKVLLAMRTVPYDRLVLLGEDGAMESEASRTIQRLEEISGHELVYETIPDKDFLGMVDMISEVLSSNAARSGGGSGSKVVLNISGGSKLLGDAALLAAFRLGVETIHCDSKAIRLPVVRGATAKSMYTSLQTRFLECIEDRPVLGMAITRMQPTSKQGAERVLRELRKVGLVTSEVVGERIHIGLSEEGAEVLRAVKMCKRRE